MILRKLKGDVNVCAFGVSLCAHEEKRGKIK